VLKPKASGRFKQFLEFRFTQTGSDKATRLVNEELVEEAAEGAVVTVRALKVGLPEDDAIGVRRDAWLDQSVKMKQSARTDRPYGQIRIDIHAITFLRYAAQRGLQHRVEVRRHVTPKRESRK
jgi:hypothetical protein